MTDIVGKLWGFCHTLRHDGIDYGDYIEQLTYLLFLKMIEEKGAEIPQQYSWAILREKSGTELTDHYQATLRGLGEQPGMLGAIYAGALSRFSNPVNLKRLVNLIDEIEWTALNIDVKAAAYEGLLEKSASEGKKGAGQYFTPRILIQSIVRCMKPDPRKTKDFTIHDPAAGTGGFLVCAYEWLIEQTKGGLEREEAKRILNSTYSGTELVPRPRRLALMNLYLHGIQANIYLGDAIYEPKRAPKEGGYDCVMTNPPFGTKGANQAPNRDDFTVATSNKQLNFVQHVMSISSPVAERPLSCLIMSSLPIRQAMCSRKNEGHFPILRELGSSIKKLPLPSAEFITTGEATSQHQGYLAQISAAKLSTS